MTQLSEAVNPPRSLQNSSPVKRAPRIVPRSDEMGPTVRVSTGGVGKCCSSAASSSPAFVRRARPRNPVLIQYLACLWSECSEGDICERLGGTQP